MYGIGQNSELDCGWRNDCRIFYNITEIVGRSYFIRSWKNNWIFEYVLWGRPQILFDQRHFVKECLHDATETGHINKIRRAVPKVLYIQSHWWNAHEHSRWGKKSSFPRFILRFVFYFLFFCGGGVDDVFVVVTQFQSITAVADQYTYFVTGQAVRDYEGPVDWQESRHCTENQNDFLILSILKNGHIPANFYPEFLVENGTLLPWCSFQNHIHSP